VVVVVGELFSMAEASRSGEQGDVDEVADVDCSSWSVHVSRRWSALAHCVPVVWCGVWEGLSAWLFRGGD